jgi:hypothetical protein
MKKVLILIALFITINATAQDDKTVTLVASGQGKTQDEAKQNALRSAIEQAFGTFISSKTEILNDNLVKDEIVSVTNGNIQKFEIISEVQIPNGGYATSLKATVSVTKLTSFVVSKGVVVEFKGSLFAFNVNQQILNEKNEIKAIEDLCNVVKKLSDASFEYSIKASDPIAVNASNEKWRIPLNISVVGNKNLLSLVDYFHSSLKGLSLSLDEASNYIKIGKLVYPISFAADKSKMSYIMLRNKESISKIMSVVYHFNYSILKFNISNGIENWTIFSKSEYLKDIDDSKFRIFLRIGNNGSDWRGYNKNSVFYTGGRGNYQTNFVLNVKDWYKTNQGYNGENMTGLLPEDFLLSYYKTVDKYKDDAQFSFISSFSKEIQNNLAGLVISFIGIDTDVKLIEFKYEDIRSLDEINKISEYKVSPIIN